MVCAGVFSRCLRDVESFNDIIIDDHDHEHDEEDE